MQEDEPQLEKFYLSKHEWLRGRQERSALWLTEKEKGCCLGLLALHCGLMKEQINGIGMPVHLRRLDIPKKYQTVMSSTSLAHQAAHINDHAALTDEQRIVLLTPIFQAWGFELILVE